MLKFVVDEDLPRSSSRVLRDRGFEVFDVRDHGLRGKSDQEVFAFAQSQGAVILTADLGFGNHLDFPLGRHAGILICHFPNELSTAELNRQLGTLLDQMSEDDLKGNLVVFEPGKIRVRRR